VLVHTDGWSGGKFKHSNYTTEESCKAACGSDVKCAGLTYVTTDKVNPCVLYTQINLQSYAALPHCHNWIKQPKCPNGPGQCGYYIDGTTRHRLNCSFENATHANPVCPPVAGGCGKGQPGVCGAVDACAAISATDVTQDVSKLKEGPAFNCSMLGHARNASRYALEYGPILMAATGTWDPLVDCVRLPEGLDVANPGTWLVPTPGVRGGFQVKTSPAFTFAPYMLVQHERFTTFPVIPTSSDRPPL